MEEKMKGRRSKYSSKQKEVIKAALATTHVQNYRLSVEELLQIPIGKVLQPDAGFEPLYTNISKGGESYHMLANNGMPYFFFLCQPDDPKILPDCETDVEAKWIADDLLEIRFAFFKESGDRYLGIPFMFFLKNDNLGGMTHRWELRNLLNYLAFEIMLVVPYKDGLLRYVGSGPVRFYEYKKEVIYDLLSRYLGIARA